MKIDEICSLPVHELANDNCILFLWVTFPRLWEGLEVINQWGFKYKGLGFNWIKLNKKSNEVISKLLKITDDRNWELLNSVLNKIVFWGMGYWTRQNSEVCLIGIKGKIPPQVKNMHSVIFSPIEEHSKKPLVVRDDIEKICGDVSRIELFARQKSEGWDVWGDEV